MISLDRSGMVNADTIAALDDLPVGIFLSDRDGQCTYVNKAWVQVTGLSMDQSLGLGWFKAIHPDDMASVLKAKAQSEETKTGYSLTYRIILPTGEIRYLHVTSTPQTDDDGALRLVIGSVLDITREERLRQQLEQENRSKSDFIARMSHEFRTPLNSILSICHLLQLEQLTASQLEYVDMLQFSTKNLLDLINDILTLNQVEAGGITLNPETFGLHDLIDTFCAPLAIKAREHGTELTVAYMGEVPFMVIGDPIRFGQILNNLISNAVKFTKDGIIRVEVQVLERDDLTVTLAVTVRDTGIGISREELPHVFDRFRQANPSISKQYGGTGLGLAISRELAQMFGGDITVASELGKGSSVTAILRFGVASPMAVTTDDRRTSQRPLEGKRILLAEDHSLNARLMRRIMEPWGARLVVAENGLEAVDIYRKEGADLVVMDLVMPLMDGLEAAMNIRKTDPDVPIIALTATSTDKARILANKAGMNGVLPKPFEPAELLRMILEHLR